MKTSTLLKYLEKWAPPGVAWDRDNVGLQAGSLSRETGNILLALDVSEKSADEAVKKKCGTIISHHPLLFKPLKKINTDSDPISAIIAALLKNNITLLSLHTNLDFTHGGVSFALAEKLGIRSPRILQPAEHTRVKLVVFVPEPALQHVAAAMFNAGAGEIGEYADCGFRTRGTGSFKGSAASAPVVGKKLRYEEVEEVRFEAVCDSWQVNQVVRAMRLVHPYEEPAFDIIPVANPADRYGAGAVGNLAKPLSEREFLLSVSKALGAKALRSSELLGGKVERVAVCGGSGADMLPLAIAAGVQAFVTADVKYHSFQEAAGKLLLIDAGHYETEIPVLPVLKKRIEGFLKDNKSPARVFIAKTGSNPVRYFY